MDSIYLLDCMYNNYNDTINYIFIYYNWHAISTHGILLIITNNKKIIEYNNIVSQVEENILLLKHQGFFLFTLELNLLYVSKVFSLFLKCC